MSTCDCTKSASLCHIPPGIQDPKLATQRPLSGKGAFCVGPCMGPCMGSHACMSVAHAGVRFVAWADQGRGRSRGCSRGRGRSRVRSCGKGCSRGWGRGCPRQKGRPQGSTVALHLFRPRHIRSCECLFVAVCLFCLRHTRICE